MNNLLNRSDIADILVRIENVSPNAQARWGKMNVNQMLAHCNASLETAMGLTYTKRLGIVGRLFGKLMKTSYFSEKPFPKNGATDKSYIIIGNRNFEEEKARVIKQIIAFSEGGPEKCTKHPQAFFGELTAHEWAIMQWKHFDHHLRQFGF